MPNILRFRFIAIVVSFCLAGFAADQILAEDPLPKPAVVEVQTGAPTPGGIEFRYGLTTEDVNLYTGGVALSIPLLSVQGRGGMDFAVSLDYSSHVQGASNAPNYEAPSSWVGLCRFSQSRTRMGFY